jgi:hypothetical protein
MAKDALDHIFFVGLQEAYDLSVKIMLREFNMSLDIEIQKERDQGTSLSIKRQKDELKGNKPLMDRVRQVNSHDLQLYELGE